MTTPATRSSLSTLKGLLPFLRAYRRQFILAACALLCAAAATLAIPYAFRMMIDLGFDQTNGKGIHQVNLAFVALFGLAVLLGLSTAARFYLVSWLGERVTADIRNAVYRHVLRQSPEFFETAKTGEVLSRLTTDTSLIQTVVGSSISMALRNSLLLAGGLIMLIVTSARLSLLIIGLLGLVVLPLIYFGKRVRKLSRASQDSVADASAIASETLNAINIVQAYTHERIESLRFQQAVEAAFKVALRRIRARSLLTLMAILLVFGAIVFVLWIGAHAVVEQRMSGGELGQFILYAAIVAGAVGALSEVMGDAQRAAGATERLLELLELESRIQDPVCIQPVAANASNGGASLDISHLQFHYPSRPDHTTLHDINLKVAAGASLALVGASGAGKTSLFQLLLRFHDPQQGRICLNGQDIRDLSLTDLRSQIGIVTQDSVIFSANAMENIRYGRPEASDDEVIAAAKLAAADEFILRLPEGYHSFLGERGVRLSGGQRQRIAIARALLKNPPLLLLDEATSALDAESERLVQSALEHAMQGRTTIVIAHRLATVQKADHILVMEHGQIVEQGTHQSLIASGGVYAHLASLQFGLSQTTTERSHH